MRLCSQHLHGGGTGHVTPPKRYTSVESGDLRDMDDEVIFIEIFNFDVVNATIYISLIRYRFSTNHKSKN